MICPNSGNTLTDIDADIWACRECDIVISGHYTGGEMDKVERLWNKAANHLFRFTLLKTHIVELQNKLSDLLERIPDGDD